MRAVDTAQMLIRRCRHAQSPLGSALHIRDSRDGYDEDQATLIECSRVE